MATIECQAHYRAFRRHFKTLETAITDPGDLATSLWAEGLIDTLACQKATSTQSAPPLERSRELLLNLEGKVREEKEAFDTFLAILDRDPTKEDICRRLRATRDEVTENIHESETSAKRSQRILCSSRSILLLMALFVLVLAILWCTTDICYHLGICYSKSLPCIDRFVGREEDIRNITGYLDFNSSDVQVVHIVGPPGFGKSTLAIKIGDIFVRKGEYVHYVDIRTVSDMNTLAEKVMHSIVESLNYKVSFDRLETWVRNQYSKTLIILDNCDELLEKHKEAFLEGIKLLLNFSRRNVKYILTSQKQVTDIGNFRLHTIYNLSSEASILLLDRLAKSLTHSQKLEIATLTGNVPLALDVVRAIFNFPDAPTAEEVIQGLRDNPVITLSPPIVHSTVNVSIRLAYSYLTPELQQLCVNLCHFPGSFSEASAIDIFSIIDSGSHSSLDMLVQRSLLHYNRATKRYHFHQLIQAFFCQVNVDEWEETSLQQFESNFLFHFAQILDTITKLNLNLQLSMEKHNFQYMFNLLKIAKRPNNTFFSVQVTLRAIKQDVLQLHFLPNEIHNICLDMLTVLESYTPDEENSVDSFHETYSLVVMLVAQQQSQSNIRDAIHTLSLRRQKIDNGHQRDRVSVDTFIMFHTDLANYYKDIGEERKAAECHAHILNIIHKQLNHCAPKCDYFSISVAYANIRDRVQAFIFRELAHKHQLHSLSPMKEAKLIIGLYNDYSSESLGNNTDKASNLSSVITERMYHILMNADHTTYSEDLDVYYDAVRFFMTNKLEKHSVQLQFKMLNATRMEQCAVSVSLKDIYHYVWAAWHRHFYYVVIGLGKRLFDITQDKKPDLAMEAASLVGQSYYRIGNYTSSKIWLKRALYLINKSFSSEYSFDLSYERGTLCFYLVRSGEFFNIFHYGYIIKHIIVAIMYIPVAIYKSWNDDNEKQPEKVILSTATDLIEQKYSYVWSQFVDNYYVRLLSMVLEIIRIIFTVLFILVILILMVIVLGCCVCCILVTTRYLTLSLMSICCTEQQISATIKRCRNICRIVTGGSIFIMILFVIGLDRFY